MRWKWFEPHNWVIFLGGYLANQNAHQPSALGMIVAEYVFWFGFVLLVLILPRAVRNLCSLFKGKKAQTAAVTGQE